MKYKIEISILCDVEGSSYPKKENIYQQVVDNIDVEALVRAINSYKEA